MKYQLSPLGGADYQHINHSCVSQPSLSCCVLEETGVMLKKLNVYKFGEGF